MNEPTPSGTSTPATRTAAQDGGRTRIRAESEAAPWMVHLYRALVQDCVMWRRRMDVTANWAVPLTIALTTFALGTRELPHHFLLVLGGTLVAVAVVIESRRYRQLHHAVWRRSLVEVGYFSGLLESVDTSEMRWRERLAEDLAHPRATIGLRQAALVRLRSTYLVLCYLLVVAWLVKVAIDLPAPASFGLFLRSMSVAQVVPGWLVAGGVIVGLGLLTVAVLAAPSAEEAEDWSTREPFSRYVRRADRSADAGARAPE